MGTYHCDFVVIPACHGNRRVHNGIFGNNAIASGKPADVLFEGGLSDGSILGLVVNANVLLPVLDERSGSMVCCRHGYGADIEGLSKLVVSWCRAGVLILARRNTQYLYVVFFMALKKLKMTDAKPRLPFLSKIAEKRGFVFRAAGSFSSLIYQWAESGGDRIKEIRHNGFREA
jgi:hypothetical protein